MVFNETRKHDGTGWRDLLSGEYTQMSGRAGRRGIDTTGIVIIVAWTEVPEVRTHNVPVCLLFLTVQSTSLKQMIVGKATKLTSQFRLTYNMILNLFKMGGGQSLL